MIRFVATGALALLVVTAACGKDETGTDMSNTNKDMSSNDMNVTPPDMTVVPPTFTALSGCATATVNLSAAYTIFNTNCAVSNCHVSGATMPVMGPNNMALFRTNIVGATANRVPASLKYVTASDLDNSMVAYKITGQQGKVQFGGNQMPNGLPPLSATDQCTIINWIRSGAN